MDRDAALFPGQIVRATGGLAVSAAARLAHSSTGRAPDAGRRLLRAARAQGIDVSLMWAAVDEGQVREVCLAVPGEGRTVMLLISSPTEPGEGLEPAGVRARVIDAACEGVAALRPAGRDPAIAQALPEPAEAGVSRALEIAGFTHVGRLAYMRRPLPADDVPAPLEFPKGLEVRPVRGCRRGEPDRAAMVRALDRSYEATLDCPELRGLRATEDVLDSHLATGRLDNKLWWLVIADGQPEGCMLLNRCPEQSTVELVYLGVSPALRGRGTGLRLLLMGLSRLSRRDGDHVTCAVDQRNEPALRVYRRLGFSRFGERVAWVKPLCAR